jgi:predicted ABC-type ATPase
MKPWLILLAGPNGSGKTTLSSTKLFQTKISEFKAIYLNPDEIAKSAPRDSNALIWSGREIHHQIETAVGDARSIMIETTLSGKNHLRIIKRCKVAEYNLALHYVFLSSIELAQARVALRVNLGGHDVPVEDQLRRYNRSISNAIAIVKYFDEAFFYNNDSLEGHLLVAEYRNGKTLQHNPNFQKWLPKQD